MDKNNIMILLTQIEQDIETGSYKPLIQLLKQVDVKILEEYLDNENRDE